MPMESSLRGGQIMVQFQQVSLALEHYFSPSKRRTSDSIVRIGVIVRGTRQISSTSCERNTWSTATATLRTTRKSSRKPLDDDDDSTVRATQAELDSGLAIHDDPDVIFLRMKADPDRPRQSQDLMWARVDIELQTRLQTGSQRGFDIRRA
ncbi:hypothetical protein SCHPADRAFT_52274 [Schizopora paradoxa]|uniref:Uncharacterized protein n=1 Tax=Schizopora paradoxa TaxID=27342 RepID=A0A0H2S6Q2_9AGAM|nr:hypothetical protein SCHPADRAFT_52274 [Schizopora paradoxa]